MAHHLQNDFVQKIVHNVLYTEVSQMKLARTFIFLVAVLAVSALVYAEQRKDEGDQQTAEFTSDADAYKFGYDHGYNHGQIDSQTGREFNYRRNPHFASGMTFDTYRDENYHEGYKKGYEQAYTEHPRNSDIQVQVIPSKQKTAGSVRIFTDTGYGGEMEQLSVGRYPYLEDWKNQIESVQVNGNLQVILFDQNNFQGQRIVLEENSPNLEASNFNKRAASMIVRIAE
jgi:Beta/Gamma crystallin